MNFKGEIGDYLAFFDTEKVVIWRIIGFGLAPHSRTPGVKAERLFHSQDRQQIINIETYAYSVWDKWKVYKTIDLEFIKNLYEIKDLEQTSSQRGPNGR